MIKKVIVIIMTILGLWVYVPTTLFVYADPMDPLNEVEFGDAQQTTAVGEAIQPNAPNAVTTKDDKETKVNKTQEEWEEEENKRKSVQFMDTIMVVAGIAGFCLATLFLGIYLGALIYPPLFLPVFSFITRGRISPQEIGVLSMFLRTIPVCVLGMLMATGQLRQIFAYVWAFVQQHLLK